MYKKLKIELKFLYLSSDNNNSWAFDFKVEIFTLRFDKYFYGILNFLQHWSKL